MTEETQDHLNDLAKRNHAFVCCWVHICLRQHCLADQKYNLANNNVVYRVHIYFVIHLTLILKENPYA